MTKFRKGDIVNVLGQVVRADHCQTLIHVCGSYGNVECTVMNGNVTLVQPRKFEKGDLVRHRDKDETYLVLCVYNDFVWLCQESSNDCFTFRSEYIDYAD